MGTGGVVAPQAADVGTVATGTVPAVSPAPGYLGSRRTAGHRDRSRWPRECARRPRGTAAWPQSAGTGDGAVAGGCHQQGHPRDAVTADGCRFVTGGCHQWATPKVLSSSLSPVMASVLSPRGCHQCATPEVRAPAAGLSLGACHHRASPGATTPLATARPLISRVPERQRRLAAQGLSRGPLCHPVIAFPCPHAGRSVTPRARGSAQRQG